MIFSIAISLFVVLNTKQILCVATGELILDDSVHKIQLVTMIYNE